MTLLKVIIDLLRDLASISVLGWILHWPLISITKLKIVIPNIYIFGGRGVYSAHILASMLTALLNFVCRDSPVLKESQCVLHLQLKDMYWLMLNCTVVARYNDIYCWSVPQATRFVGLFTIDPSIYGCKIQLFCFSLHFIITVCVTSKFIMSLYNPSFVWNRFF